MLGMKLQILIAMLDWCCACMHACNVADSSQWLTPSPGPLPGSSSEGGVGAGPQGTGAHGQRCAHVGQLPRLGEGEHSNQMHTPDMQRFLDLFWSFRETEDTPVSRKLKKDNPHGFLIRL
jgi:hypothetical protein